MKYKVIEKGKDFIPDLCGLSIWGTIKQPQAAGFD